MHIFRMCLRTYILTIVLVFVLQIQLNAQSSSGQPVWWYGGAVGPNFNFYSSSIQHPNASITTPSGETFTGGSGSGTFFAPMIEYRPNAIWGGMLAFGFDGRGGSFDDIPKAGLSTSMNYLSLEPSVRYSPFDFGLYFFGGPRLAFNVAQSFTYVSATTPQTSGDWSGIHGAVFGLQLGAGYEFSVTPPTNNLQIHIAPFLAGLVGEGPRSDESWSLSTIRAGVAILLAGKSFGTNEAEEHAQFSVRAPRVIPNERTVKETFPIRNYIFFDEGSNSIPSRYVVLTKEQADAFKEDQLLHPEPKDLTGRSRRQMITYHNILNILGDRLRRFSNASVTLLGSSSEGSSNGQALADAVKQYLVNVFGIEGSRILTRGATQPPVPSYQPGGTREVDLVKPEDRRVEISSATAGLLEPVQIVSLEEDPLESDILLNVPDAQNQFASWSVVVKDDQGMTRRFGPFTSDQERISGKSILANAQQGTYTITMEAQTKNGDMVTKEQSFHLMKSNEPEEAPGYRFSILFEFDQSKTVATYERFLTETVAPLIADGNSVIIHGHTDIVGEESHNLNLSRDRAQQTMAVLQRELAKAGKSHVKFDTYGFGEDVRRAPFENRLPEERFYNRTVIIDIVPE